MFELLQAAQNATAGLTAAPWVNSLLSELLVIGAALLVLFLIFKIGKFLLRLIFGLVANSLLGLIIIFVVNTWLGMGIPYNLQVMLPTALFGIPGIGTIILMKALGVTFGFA